MQCPLCRIRPRRTEKVPDINAHLIDCGDCGIYEIGGTTRAQLSTRLRDEAFIGSMIRRIRLANAKRLLFHYPSGATTANHPWLEPRRVSERPA